MDLKPAAGGARQSGTAYLLNGADNNDNFSGGGVNVGPPLESVGEFSVLTNSFGAQFGRAGGAIVSAAQKSGTNQFHGVLYEFNRNRSFNANDFFSNRDGADKPKYIRNPPMASLSTTTRSAAATPVRPPQTSPPAIVISA